MPHKYTPEERIAAFWNKVDQSGGDDACWLWTASHDKRWGYGRMRWGNRDILAHRIAYQLANGECPDNLLVCHSCDNPICVNPKHLFLGTHQDNSNDKVSKGRQWRPIGEKGRHKLSWSDVTEIRKLCADGYKYKELAVRFNVTPGMIGHIVRGANWKTNSISVR